MLRCHPLYLQRVLFTVLVYSVLHSLFGLVEIRLDISSKHIFKLYAYSIQVVIQCFEIAALGPTLLCFYLGLNHSYDFGVSVKLIIAGGFPEVHSGVNHKILGRCSCNTPVIKIRRLVKIIMLLL